MHSLFPNAPCKLVLAFHLAPPRNASANPTLTIFQKFSDGALPRFYGSEQRHVSSTYGGSKPPTSAEGVVSHLATALSYTAKYRSLTLCVEDLRCSFELAGLAGGGLNLRERATRAFSTIYCLFPKYFNFPRVDHIASLHDATSVPLKFKYPHYETEYKIDMGIHWVDQRIWSQRQKYHKKAQAADGVDKMKKGGCCERKHSFSVLPDDVECKSNNLQRRTVGVVRYHLRHQIKR